MVICSKVFSLGELGRGEYCPLASWPWLCPLTLAGGVISWRSPTRHVCMRWLVVYTLHGLRPAVPYRW